MLKKNSLRAIDIFKILPPQQQHYRVARKSTTKMQGNGMHFVDLPCREYKVENGQAKVLGDALIFVPGAVTVSLQYAVRHICKLPFMNLWKS